MTVFKHILLRVLFFITALQILNLSIDVDGIFMYDHAALKPSFDDMDSYSEFLVEFLADDDHLTSEDDNDNGNSNHNNSLKYQPLPLYTEGYYFFQFPAKLQESILAHHIRNSSTLSTGYVHVILPPPDLS